MEQQCVFTGIFKLRPIRGLLGTALFFVLSCSAACARQAAPPPNMCVYTHEDYDTARKAVKAMFPVGLSLDQALQRMRTLTGAEQCGVAVGECGGECGFMEQAVTAMFPDSIPSTGDLLARNIFVSKGAIIQNGEYPYVSGWNLAFLSTCNIADDNANIWEVTVNFDDDKRVRVADLSLFFHDKNFTTRNMKIHRDLFLVFSHFMEAMISVIENSSQNNKELYEIIKNSGYKNEEYINEDGSGYYIIHTNTIRKLESILKSTTDKSEKNSVSLDLPSLLQIISMLNPNYTHLDISFDKNGQITRMGSNDPMTHYSFKDKKWISTKE